MRPSQILERIEDAVEEWVADNRPVRAKTAERRAQRAASLAYQEAETRLASEERRD